MRTPTATVAVATALTLATLLSGCASSSSAEPARDPTAEAAAAAAKEKADAYAGSEKSLRTYYSEMSKWANTEMPVRPHVAKNVRAQHNEFVRLLKKEGRTVKGESKLLSLTPEQYIGAPQWQTTMKACSLETGGIYDKSGKNVEVDASGKAVTDKERRLEMRYHLRRVPDDGRWEITDETHLGPC